ncbi:MAG: tetratricopeptide repeat protein, partial [Pseudomonadota bacterium]
MTSDRSEPHRRLVGWKRIAAHLRCSERTARRWEAQECLPVQRHEHDARSTVFAYAEALDEWLASRAPREEAIDGGRRDPPAPPPPARPKVRSRTFTVALGLAIALAALIAVPYLSDTDAPPRVSADPLANDLYHRGRTLWEQRGEAANTRAIKMLTAAVERDEDFALAWSALASAWATYATYSPDIAEGHAMDQALIAANRALELDPTLTEPRSLTAYYAQRTGNWIESHRIYETALSIDPDNSNLMLWFAGHYRELGMFERAGELTRQARALAPNSPAVLTEIAMNHLQAYEADQARSLITYLRDDLGMETPILWFGHWISLLREDDDDALRQWIEETPFIDLAPLFTDFVSARHRERTEVDALANRIDQTHAEGLAPAWIAYYLLDQLDRPDEALAVAEREALDEEFI